MSVQTAATLLAGWMVSASLLVGLTRYRDRTRFPRKCKVVKLFIYPVKGLKGIELESVEALQRGFKHDRRFMVVDEEYDDACKILKECNLEPSHD